MLRVFAIFHEISVTRRQNFLAHVKSTNFLSPHFTRNKRRIANNAQSLSGALLPLIYYYSLLFVIIEIDNE